MFSYPASYLEPNILFSSLLLICFQVVARVQNGGGVIKTTWTPSDGATLCDGKWHKIVFTKSGSIVSLQIDSNAPVTAERGIQSVANVKDSIYLGGVPGSATRFVACRDIKVHMERIFLLSH